MCEPNRRLHRTNIDPVVTFIKAKLWTQAGLLSIGRVGLQESNKAMVASEALARGATSAILSLIVMLVKLLKRDGL